MFIRLMLFILSLLFVGCSSVAGWQYPPESASDEIEIYVVSHGWHTGVAIPGNQLGNELGFLTDVFGENPYYEIGWGDHGFYQAQEITAGIVVKALLLPSESVTHVVSLPIAPDRYFSQSEVLKIKISRRGFYHLKQSIRQSFKQYNDDVLQLGNGLYGDSLFFQAEGSFHLLNTCNSWTSHILKAAGVPVKFSLTSDSVMKQARSAVNDCLWCQR